MKYDWKAVMLKGIARFESSLKALGIEFTPFNQAQATKREHFSWAFNSRKKAVNEHLKEHPEDKDKLLSDATAAKLASLREEQKNAVTLVREGKGYALTQTTSREAAQRLMNAPDAPEMFTSQKILEKPKAVAKPAVEVRPPAPAVVTPKAAPAAKPEATGFDRAREITRAQLSSPAKAAAKLPIDPRPVTSKPLCVVSLVSAIYGESYVEQLCRTVGSENLENRCGRLLHLDALGSYVPGFNASIFAEIGEPRKFFGMGRVAHAEKVQKLQSALLAQGITHAV